MIDTLKHWRSEESTWIQYWSAEQDKAAKSKDFDLARFFGDCKKSSLQHLARVNKWIFEEVGYSQ